MRAAVERRVAVPLAYAAHLPRWLILGIVIAPALLALFVQGIVGAIALGLLALLLGLLSYVSWPAVPPQGRILRLATIGLVIVAAVVVAGK